MPKRLTPRGEGAPPVEPVDTGVTLPPRPAKKQRQAAEVSQESVSGVKYVYNLRTIQLRVTLTTGRAINLEPRGQRGDLDVVNEDEQKDPIFLANRGLVFEVIEPEMARNIIANQQTNTSQGEHPVWAHLRNERGDEYSQRETRVEEATANDITVGQVNEVGGGAWTTKTYEVSRSAGPHIAQAPGSPEHPATKFSESVPGDVPPELYHEFLAWKQFMAQRELAEESSDEAE